MNQNYQENIMSLQQPISDDEIDLRELFGVIWAGKWLIIAVTFAFAVGGVMYALSQPNTYKSEVLLSPAQGGGSSALGGLAGLAGLAGVSIGGGGDNDPSIEATAVLQSRQFTNYFIKRHHVLVPLMAGVEWNKANEVLEINPDLYDIEKKEWQLDGKGESLKPTRGESFKAFKSAVSVAKDKETGLVTLSVTSLSPLNSKAWVDKLVVELNAWMKAKKLKESNKRIRYLKKQLRKTQVAEIQTLFYQMIEDQYKDKMVAAVETEYIFKTLDPALVPEEKAGPKRALICVLATLLGGMFAVFIVLIRHFMKNEDDEVLSPVVSNEISK